MFGIDGQYVIDINVDGQPLSIQMGSFERILLCESVQAAIPQFEVKLYDTTGTLASSQTIQDGSTFQFQIGRDSDDAANQSSVEYNYRCFGVPKISVGARPMYVLSGTLDAMKYWRGVPNDFINGTSADCISKIATDCSLTPDVVSTNDMMNWILSYKNYTNLAHYAADHGYVDSDSVMLLACTSAGVLIYRDMTTLLSQTPTITFFTGNTPDDGSTAAHILHKEIKATSGIMNNLFNYGSRMLQEQKDGSAQVISSSDVTLFSNTLAINSAVKTDVQSVRREYVPPNSGNTHTNHTQAEYQNRKGRASFVTKIEVTVMQAVGGNLLDTVRLQFQSGTGDNLDQTYNGLYVITAKARCIFGNQYYEKYQLTTQGLQTNVGSDLLTAFA